MVTVYLVPPEPISVPLRFVRQGMRYADLPDDEKEAWDAIEWDEDGGRRCECCIMPSSSRSRAPAIACAPMPT